MPRTGVPHAWQMPRAVVFLAIIEHGSISAAARAMNLSKSVVSTHLRQLEETCGARLIERTTRQLRLTDAGARFLPFAQRAASAWSDGLEEVAATMSEPVGTLTVTATTLMERVVVAPAVAAFLGRYPRVTVDVRLTDAVVDVVSENVDLAIRVGVLQDSSLIARKLGEDADRIVASKSLAPMLQDIQTPEQLHTVPWLAHGGLPSRREIFGPDGRRFVLEVEPRARVDSAAGLLGLALAGAGVTLVPGLLAREALRTGALVSVLEDWRAAPMGIYALCPSRRHLPPKVDRFIQEVERQLH